MNPNPRLKLALVIIASILIVALAAAVLIWPAIQRASETRDLQVDAETQLLAARTQLAARKKFATQQEEMQAALKLQKEQIPEEAELSDVLRSIQNLAYKNEHWLFNITNTDPIETEGEACRTWEARFTVEGSWLNTLDFLRDLRDMGRQIRVTEVVFDRATELRGNTNPAARVVKHWDPEAYPMRTAITCEFYFISDEAVDQEIKDRAEREKADAKLQAELEKAGTNANENVVSEGGQ